jgi:hypothetical protein
MGELRGLRTLWIGLGWWQLLFTRPGVQLTRTDFLLVGFGTEELFQRDVLHDAEVDREHEGREGA